MLLEKEEKEVNENGFGDVAMRTAVVVGGRKKDNVNREHERGRQDSRNNAENPRPLQVSGSVGVGRLQHPSNIVANEVIKRVGSTCSFYDD